MTAICLIYRALLYGGLKESHEPEVEITDASVNSFKKLLEYIYSGRMNLSVLKVKLIISNLIIIKLINILRITRSILIFFF